MIASSTAPTRFVLAVLLVCALLLGVAGSVRAEEPDCCAPCKAPRTPAPALADGSVFGCPRTKWPVLYKRNRLRVTGSLRVALGTFTSQGSWFGNAPTVIGERSGLTWAESYFDAGIDVAYQAARGSTVYGRVSAIGDASFGTDATGETDRREFAMEEYYVGWKSGRLFGRLGTDALDISVGGREFQLGSGMLIWEGGINGGDVGDVYLSPRTAFELSAVATLDTGGWLAQIFFLQPHRQRRSATRARLAGINLERSFGRASSVGVSYIRVLDSNRSARAELNVIDLRAQGCPIRQLPGLDVAGEFAYEFKGGLRRAFGGYGEVGHRWCRHCWRPRLSYRLAWFSGDDPNTARNEAFDPLYYGGSAEGTWFQGVVLGNFVTTNSNLITHQLKLTARPSSKLKVGAIGWLNLLDQPATYRPVASLGPPSSRALAWEIDLFAEWQVSGAFSLVGELGAAFPQTAARQAFASGDPWIVAALTATLDL